MNDPTMESIAFYKFFPLSQDLTRVRDQLQAQIESLNIKGTILIAPEGINASLTGSPSALDSFIDHIKHDFHLEDLVVKKSRSNPRPFNYAWVKIKKSIVPNPGATPLDLTKDTAPYLSPQEFHEWLKDGKKLILLDTRNDYEFEVGKFTNTEHLGTKHFSEFEKDLEKAPASWKTTPIVTFCTGGIRCEKAAPLMLKKGFKEVYQLDGGILNYFEKMGRGFFEGGCFVFDQRVSLNEKLEPTGEAMCFTCQSVLSIEDQKSPLYQAPDQCPYCATPDGI